MKNRKKQFIRQDVLRNILDLIVNDVSSETFNKKSSEDDIKESAENIA